MNVSVVVSTKGRDSVYKTIESLCKQTHPVEIILINDGHEKSIKLPDTTIVYIKNKEPRGLSICRNLGVERSSGEIVAFIDDDAFADPYWIEEIEKSFKNGADIAGGLIKPAWEDKKPWWLKKTMYHIIAVNTPSHMIFGCNFAIRQKLLEEMNYCFEPTLGRKKGNLIVGDETTLFFRAEKYGYKILFNEKAIVNHIVPKQRLTVSYFIRRFFWEGRTEVRRGMAKKSFFVRLRYLKYYFYGIIKSKSIIDSIENFGANTFFSIFYFYGMFHEKIFGASDYKNINHQDIWKSVR